MKLKTFIIAILIFISSPIILYLGYTKYIQYKLNKEFDERYQKRIKEIKEFQKFQLEYLKQQEREINRLTKLYKQDHYGGKTPEETLKLFVDALKKKDYKLAAKYYVPEKWEWAEEHIKKWIQKYPTGLQMFIDTYDKQLFKLEDTGIEDYINLHMFKNTKDNISYVIEFKLNPIRGIWKIEEI